MIKVNSKNNHRIVRLFFAIFLLSQWFSLAHATDHILQDKESVCHVCKINSDYGQAAAVNYSQDFTPALYIYELPNYETQHHSISCYVKTIRGPPKTLL
jgi:hypothetical protein